MPIDLTYQLNNSGAQVQNTLDKVPVNESAIGTLSNLTTTEKGSLVGAINEVNAKAPSIATTSNVGVVKPDGTSISVDGSGTISGYGGITLTAVWTNLNPTSSFAHQTISVDISSYELLYIEYLVVNNSTTYVTHPLIKNGGQQRHEVGQRTTTALYVRDVTPTDSSIEFTDCAQAGNTNNGYMIPYKIIGVK